MNVTKITHFSFFFFLSRHFRFPSYQAKPESYSSSFSAFFSSSTIFKEHSYNVHIWFQLSESGIFSTLFFNWRNGSGVSSFVRLTEIYQRQLSLVKGELF